MRIGIDANPLLGIRTGIGRYTLSLLQNLLRLSGHGVDEVQLLASLGWRRRRRSLAELEEIRSKYFSSDPVALRCIHLPSKVVQLLWRTAPGTCTDRWLSGLDLFHGVNFWVPPLVRVPSVITVHDLGFLVRPELHTPAQRAIRAKLSRSLGRCSHVLTVSHSTRNDFLRHFRFPQERVRVTPLAADPVFRRIADPKAREDARRRLGFPEMFVLSVATLDPRKNLEGLVQGFHRALPHLPDRCMLLLVGPEASATDSIARWIRKCGIESRVVRTGYLPEEDLVFAYNLARCLIYPSHYEGFGLPVVEAMSCGTPVICSRTSSLPEVVDKAGILIDPNDPEAIAKAILRIVWDDAEALRLSELGLARARSFSWQKTAAETLAVYREAALGRT